MIKNVIDMFVVTGCLDRHSMLANDRELELLIIQGNVSRATDFSSLFEKPLAAHAKEFYLKLGNEWAVLDSVHSFLTKVCG